jgi:hypothetical protein
MNEATMIAWLLQLGPIGVALIIGFLPALIARCKRRPMTPCTSTVSSVPS